MNKLSVLAILAALSPLAASAEVIVVNSKTISQTPVVMRGAPLRCDGSAPLIIHLKSGKTISEPCVPVVHHIGYAAPVVNQTIVVYVEAPQHRKPHMDDINE